MTLEVVVHGGVEDLQFGGVLPQKMRSKLLQSSPDSCGIAGQVVGTEGNYFSITPSKNSSSFSKITLMSYTQ